MDYGCQMSVLLSFSGNDYNLIYTFYYSDDDATPTRLREQCSDYSQILTTSWKLYGTGPTGLERAQQQ